MKLLVSKSPKMLKAVGQSLFACHIRHSMVILRASSTGAAAAPAKLLKYPVPKLHDTMTKFLRSIVPLLSEKELYNTEQVICDFIKPCGEGERLQKLLEQKAASTMNWLSGWWLDLGYLEVRESPVGSSSPGLVFPQKCFQNEDAWLSFTASLISASMAYKDIIYSGKMKQEFAGKSPLDMSQYKLVFGTTRIPCQKKDRLRFLEASCNNEPQHIVVSHNNQFFKVYVYNQKGEPVSKGQIEKQLQCIVQEARTKCALPIGALSADNRDVWATNYLKLQQDCQNQKSLEALETCLFLVCLDGPPAPCAGAFDYYTRNSLTTIHGGGSKGFVGNRWYDKTIQFMIGSGGDVGLTYEHSPAEGPPLAMLLDFIEKSVKENQTAPDAACPLNYCSLSFNTDPVKEDIEKALKNVDKIVADLEFNCIKFDKYGKEFIKKQKMSPDSFIQIMLQYTFYKIHKIPAAHYESASLRRYEGGRTETIRTCSIESFEFCKAMENPCCAPETKVKFLMEAINSHKKYANEAMSGEAVDRHLFGLKVIAKENNIPLHAFFSDVGYTRSTSFRISSSQVACKNEGLMCYGPLVNNGYATCYNPRPDDIYVAICAHNSCSETSAKKYAQALIDSFTELKKTLESAKPPSKL